MPEPEAKIPPLTGCVILACVLIFLGIKLQGTNPTYAQLAPFGVYPTADIWEGKPWALITAAFVHFEPWHLLFNLYWLWHLGGNVERDIGSLKWAAFVVAAAWVSSAAQLASGETGIGFSGVGYALFGFAWVAQDKLPRTRPIVHEGTVNLFLVWLVLCIALTKFGVMNVGNEAHFGGLAFGAAVGGAFARKRYAALSALAVVLLIALSFVPLFYCPLSSDWTSHTALEAHQKDDVAAASYWYRRTIALGDHEDKAWAWQNLALLAADKGDRAAFDEALSELRKLDPQAAQDVQKEWHGSK